MTLFCVFDGRQPPDGACRSKDQGGNFGSHIRRLRDG
jgi:hypothetical protein